MAGSTHLSIIILSVISKMFQSKSLRMAPTGSELCTCCLQETHITSKDTDKLRVRGMEKRYSMQMGKKEKLR